MSARQPWAESEMEFRLRSAGPRDRDRVRCFLAAMDHEGLYQRHFAHGEAPNLALLERIDALDRGHRAAVLAIGRDGEVLGHGEYVAAHGEAEFAFMVLPGQRARGIGTALLCALIDIATAAGERRMHGMIQASNTRALQLVLNNGFRVLPGEDATVVIVSRDLTLNWAEPFAQAPDRLSPPLIRHDPDRTPLHRRPGSGAPFRAGGG